MTVLQFLRDRYCGKSIKYYVRTSKYDNGEIEEEIVFPNTCYLPEWVNRGAKANQELVKDVETIGKVVSVNPFRNKWKLELLDGSEIIMSQYEFYEFYPQPKTK
jgi:hypothetical protein